MMIWVYDLDENGNQVRYQVEKTVQARTVTCFAQAYVKWNKVGVWCAACGRWAQTHRARQQLDRTGCQPTCLQGMLAMERMSMQAVKIDIGTDELEMEATSCDIIDVAMQAANR